MNMHFIYIICGYTWYITQTILYEICSVYNNISIYKRYSLILEGTGNQINKYNMIDSSLC